MERKADLRFGADSPPQLDNVRAVLISVNGRSGTGSPTPRVQHVSVWSTADPTACRKPTGYGNAFPRERGSHKEPGVRRRRCSGESVQGIAVPERR
jgi:hypothetical protein